MKLLAPLGLLGLISILILIFIYIIKPNYQQKRISTTFVWKLSLQYKKKKIPLSKLRNILLIICQVLILIAASLILSQPNRVLKVDQARSEVVAILDSSASMLTEDADEVTRYERALTEVKNQADSVLAKEDGLFSLIVANEAPYFLIERVTNKYTGLESELETIEDSCSYASSDIETAVLMCEDILLDNSHAQIVIITDKTYDSLPEGITVIDVKDEEEYNVGILDASAYYDDICNTFTITVGYYGNSTKTVHLNLNIPEANPSDSSSENGVEIDLNQEIYFPGSMTKTIIFKYFSEDEMPEEAGPNDEIVYYPIGDNEKVYRYKSAIITLTDEAGYSDFDSFVLDNTFQLYGGLKPVIKVVYASALPNPFVPAAIQNLKNKVYKDVWDIQLTEIKMGGEVPTEGYDLYIFEDAWQGTTALPSVVPDKLPQDGAVILLNPLKAPTNGGFHIDKYLSLGNNLQYIYRDTEVDHVLLENVYPDDIGITRYNRIDSYDSYETLMYFDEDPVFMIKNDGADKIAVLNFSVHFSNIALTSSWPHLIKNIYDYFFPTTVTSNAFEINESVILNSRGEQLLITGTNLENGIEFKTFPAEYQFTAYGTYEITQTTYYGVQLTDKVFVRIPRAESDIYAAEASIESPYKETKISDFYQNLLLYFAIALVTILFIEWLLHIREEA